MISLSPFTVVRRLTLEREESQELPASQVDREDASFAARAWAESAVHDFMWGC